jgi:succinate dehydrogenase / fumarate reductase membrane anchor subunit
MRLRDPLAVARGLGSAKDGTGHFITERLTALALVPLTLWFLWSAVGHFGTGYADTRSFLAQPMNASLAAAFVLMLYWHAALGLQVVIEDYVGVRWLEMTAIIVVKLVFSFFALVSLLAIIRITLGG